MQLPSFLSFRRQQKTFVEAGAFIKIMSLLVNSKSPLEQDKKELTVMCGEVLQTLISLMANNLKNKVREN
jgi:hypothetical protein